MKTVLKFLAALVAAWVLAHCAPPAAVQTATTTYTTTTAATTSVNPEVARLQAEVARLRQARGGETVGEALARAGAGGGIGIGGGMPTQGYAVRMPTSTPLAGMAFIGPNPWRETGGEFAGSEVSIQFNLSGYSARIIVNGVPLRVSEGMDGFGQPISASLLTSSGMETYVVPSLTIADATARYLRINPMAEQRIRIELFRSNSWEGIGHPARVCTYTIPEGDNPAPGVEVSLGLMGTCR
ncbi:hypothetical protein KBB27_00060 [Patescibacteria group bacterium]|nr:hypothetical protein [Patescibacteria group bacterium]